MAWGKGKTEKGQGKLGHSNRDGWSYHDEEKFISKKQRRLAQRQLILNETSEIQENVRKRVHTIIQILDEHKLNFDIYQFDSRAVIMDLRVGNDFYCVQITDNRFGWTKVDENVGFCSIPDSGYLDRLEHI